MINNYYWDTVTNNYYWDTDMPELFEKARRENLWFNCKYQNLWFTPDELEQLHKEGKFRWGACNWRLLSPTVRVKEIEKRIRTFQKELASVKKKMGITLRKQKACGREKDMSDD